MRGYTSTGNQFRAELKQPHVLTHAFGQFRISKQPNIHVFGLWEETQRKATQAQREREMIHKIPDGFLQVTF